MARLDIGIASWQNPDMLLRTLRSVRETCQSDWRCFVIDNASPDPRVRQVIEGQAMAERRIVPVFLEQNTGYVGAVNHLFTIAETEMIAYSDNDVEHHTPGWDVLMVNLLERNHQIGIVSPGSGPYPIPCGEYHRVLWSVGCAWVVNRMAANDARKINPVGYPEPGVTYDPSPFFDPTIFHHEEVDAQTRLALAGWEIAGLPTISITHHETASRSPEAQDRINEGVRRWCTKWTRYFCGAKITYHSPNVLRHHDWPVHKLHLEEYFKARLGLINANPEPIVIDGVEYDLIKFPNLARFYRDRIV